MSTEPTYRDADSLLFCWDHFEIEPDPTGLGGFRCGECNHAFSSDDDLVRAEMAEWGQGRAARLITACPYCLHDF